MALIDFSRRVGLAAAVSGVAAIALAAAVVGRSCQVTEAGPDGAVRDMVRAAKAGERQVVFELLTPATQQRLEALAQHATGLAGAARRFSALDLVAITRSEEFAPPTDITVIEERGDRAVVEIVSERGRSRVDLVKLRGEWRIDLPNFGQ